MKTPLTVFALLFFSFLALAPALAYEETYRASSTPFNESFQTRLITLTNNDRLVAGVPEVLENTRLSAAAQKKAEDMARSSYFSHYSPVGISPWHWFTSVGYRYTNAAENLAIDFSDPEKLESAWMASAGHRANIVRPIYKEIGIGVAQGTYLGRPATFIVQLFATPVKFVKKV